MGDKSTPYSVLKKIMLTCSDADYGKAIERWRKDIFENTIGKVYFWAVMVLGTGFGCGMIESNLY